MAINYFDQLGFGNLGQNMQQAAQSTQGLRANEQAMQMNQQNMQRQQTADQQAMLKFASEQQRQQAAQGAGAFYNALNSGNDQAALQIAQQYQQDINSLGDPSFTVESVAELMKTPEGKEQLKQMSLGMVQMAGGPEQMARFTAQQAAPERQQDATAQIKNTAEYRRYTQAIRDAVASGDTAAAKDLIAERDFFVKQTDPFERGMATGDARVITEQNLNPVLTDRTSQQEAAKLEQQGIVKQRQKQQKDNTAFRAYEQAAGSVNALSGQAGSGVFGLAPAVFADDRLFEGAIAILRPTIKDVVREAGEGTFTEGDQKVLDQMMPTRVDSPQVRTAKLEMLDRYIRAKLGQEMPAMSQDTFLDGAGRQEEPAPPAQQSVGGYKIIEVR